MREEHYYVPIHIVVLWYWPSTAEGHILYGYTLEGYILNGCILYEYILNRYILYVYIIVPFSHKTTP